VQVEARVRPPVERADREVAVLFAIVPGLLDCEAQRELVGRAGEVPPGRGDLQVVAGLHLGRPLGQRADARAQQVARAEAVAPLDAVEHAELGHQALLEAAHLERVGPLAVAAPQVREPVDARARLLVVLAAGELGRAREGLDVDLEHAARTEQVERLEVDAGARERVIAPVVEGRLRVDEGGAAPLHGMLLLRAGFERREQRHLLVPLLGRSAPARVRGTLHRGRSSWLRSLCSLWCRSRSLGRLLGVLRLGLEPLGGHERRSPRSSFDQGSRALEPRSRPVRGRSDDHRLARRGSRALQPHAIPDREPLREPCVEVDLVPHARDDVHLDAHAARLVPRAQRSRGRDEGERDPQGAARE
jgi:hypothetical protein